MITKGNLDFNQQD